jgi:hypothetical protein
LEKALYGLASAGRSWRDYCASVLREDLGFVPCKADKDVWMKPATKE